MSKSDFYKATGAEINAFYAAWPQGDNWAHEDSWEVQDDETFILNPAELYEVDDVLGYLLWHGKGKVPTTMVINGVTLRWFADEGGPPISHIFAAWRGEKRPVVLLLDPDQITELTAVCRDKGWPEPSA